MFVFFLAIMLYRTFSSIILTMVETSIGKSRKDIRVTPERRTFAVAEYDASKREKQEHINGRVSMDKRSPEAILESKVNKITLPTLWKQKAEFLPATMGFFQSVGISHEHVNPVPIGEGLTNVVFAYQPPESPKKVIKIARQMRKGFMSTGYDQDRDNIALVRKYFGAYAVPTEIRINPETKQYLIVQDAVTGKAVTNRTESAHVRAQLVDIARLNREMMRQTGHSLDIIGVPGFLTWLRHHFTRIVTGKGEFQLSNILEQPDGKLKIIDEGLLRFRGVPLKQRFISNLGFLANQIIMRFYFGVDLQPQ
jgi:hypothetical protein